MQVGKTERIVESDASSDEAKQLRSMLIDRQFRRAATSRSALAHPHRRSAAHQSRARIHRRRRQAAAAADRLHAVLPRRSGRGRQGHARHDPPAPVHQGRTGLDHHAGKIQRRARAHAGLRRGSAEEARSALPRGHALHRRHGLRRAEDLRHRGLAAGPEHVSRDFLLLGVRRVPGAAHECALPRQGRQVRPRPHAQRLRRRGRPRADRGDGNLSARRRRDRRAGGAQALYGRRDEDRANSE